MSVNLKEAGIVVEPTSVSVFDKTKGAHPAAFTAVLSELECLHSGAISGFRAVAARAPHRRGVDARTRARSAGATGIDWQWGQHVETADSHADKHSCG